MTRNIIREIKEQFDWDAYVRTHYKVRTAHGKNGVELRIDCPKCGDADSKCYINPDRKAFFCFKCDFNTTNYDLFDFVSVTEDIPKGTALLRLVREFKPVTPDEPPVYEENGTEIIVSPIRYITSLPKEAKPVVVGENPAWFYLKKRGFQESDLVRTKAHYVASSNCPVYDSTGKYKGDIGNRVLFPIYHENKLCGWIGRSIKDDGSFKYFNSPETDISKTLWPYVPPFEDHAVIVEGLLDALSVRRVPNVAAYATFGKKISTEQIQILKSWGVKSVTLWFDKKDAVRDMIKNVEVLKLHFQEVYVLDMKDWDPKKDTGYYLSQADGPDIIGNTLKKRINVYDELEYAAWTQNF